MTAVSQTSKKPVKALKLIELMNTDKELYNLIAYGIKGKHYNLSSENKVEYIENSGYAPKAAWKFGNQFNAYLEAGQDDNTWKETERLNNESEKSPILGFVLNTDPIVSEISQVETVLGEFKVLNNGAEDPGTYWDTFKKKLKAAGHDRIKAEVERQIKEFFKNS